MDAPFLESNPHNSLLLNPFIDYGFKELVHIGKEDVKLFYNNNTAFHIPIMQYMKDLDFASLNIITSTTSFIASSYFIISINNSLEYHDFFSCIPRNLTQILDMYQA